VVHSPAVGRVVRAAVASTAAVVAIVLALAVATLWWRTFREPTAVDYVALYAGGRLARSEPASVYDLDRVRQVEEHALGDRELSEGVLPFPYPPFVALAMVPLALPGLPVSYALATALNLACLALTLRVLARRLATGAAARRWLVLLTAMSLPVWFTLLQGQVSLVVLLLVTLHVLDLRDGREGRAGVWLALLTFKPQLVPLFALVLVVRRGWRTLLAAGVTGGLLWSIGLIWAGQAGIAGYVAVTGRMASAVDTLGVHPAQMFSLRALALAVVPPGSGHIAVWIGLVALVGAVTLRAHRPVAGAAWAWRWAATCLAVLLVSPHVNLHDLALLQLPVALLLAGTGGPATTGAIVVLATAPLAALWAGSGGDQGSVLVVAALCGAFAVLVVCGETAACRSVGEGSP
jgi:hypothetical protein